MIVTRTEAKSVGSPLSLDCALAVHGWLSVRASEIPATRSRVATAYETTLSSGILKQADEQSLVALMALHGARLELGADFEEMSAWGLIASPRMPGRRRIAESLVKFREQGAWTTSPHIIPHCSLHSLPGLLSQALRLHGPNIGVGGLIGSEAEAFWAAMALLHGERLPGVWIVLTGWNQETLDTTDCECQAGVIALRRTVECVGRPVVRFTRHENSAGRGPLTLEAIGQAVRERKSVAWNGCGATISFDFASTRLEAAA